MNYHTHQRSEYLHLVNLPSACKCRAYHLMSSDEMVQALHFVNKNYMIRLLCDTEFTAICCLHIVLCLMSLGRVVGCHIRTAFMYKYLVGGNHGKQLLNRQP